MDKVLDLIKSEFHLRVIEESLARIQQCMDLLTTEELWYRHNSNTNSIGNLVLHLEGNIRQYIVSGIGKTADMRERDKEFMEGYSYTSQELLDRLTTTLYTANDVVSKLSFDALAEEVTIQGFQHTNLSAIIHVIEHLSYHVGQITYFTKYIKDIDTAYYGGLDLNVVGE